MEVGLIGSPAAASRSTFRGTGEAGERRFDGARGGLPEAADRGVAHRLAELLEQRPLPRYGAERRAARQPVEQLLLAHGADAAGDALAARLVAEELGDAAQDL